MTCTTQIVMILCVSCVFNLEGNASLKRRLNTLEMRVNSIEMRVNTDNVLTRNTFKLMEQGIEALNTSLIILEDQMCLNVKDKYNGEIQHDSGQSLGISKSRETIISKGFSEEKKWLRNKVNIIENDMRRVVNQVENNNSTTEELISRMHLMVNDLDRKLDAAISEVMANCSAEIRKRDEIMNEQQLEIDSLKHFVYSINQTVNKVKGNASCPNGWTHFQSFCYLYVEEKMIYISARDTCLKMGANVADIQSQSENDFIYKLCEDKGHTWTSTPSDDGNVWIGLSDEKTEDVWISDRTGEKSTYMRWRFGQPDGGTNQNCIMMGYLKPFDEWNDWSCVRTDQQAHFVCKKEPE